ncbi:FecR family protein [Pseudomonas gingeri]|uniref:FecR domain-containing protein n=1 Tax=Pseudomonas gingeri TaxID=117681 RepID=A0A7Y7YDJ0_9PSED|nr:FecR domain-containing protein [Pseudomonas gingeri]NWA16380.1 FecR domain-containing protein [Pseudomonas gingeri]NWA54736.1 FecR domain-containing protein [Pseudomonas gingeri]NWA99125.1 FecR domain-containing protein [Pseudomonas gingeri]NWB05607.1 FecR domain-containing protein [Pseudomonas gingeri]
MTDSPNLHSPEPARQVLQDNAMDQALDWLIVMECPSAEQRVEFNAWLAADPAHAQAYARASGAWNAEPVIAAAQALQARRRPSLPRRLRPHWKPLATAAVLLIAIGTYGNLPLRLQADHLTVVGERQHLQLEDGSKVLLNTNSAFSSSFTEQRHVARLYKGEAFFEVSGQREHPLEVDAGPVQASVRDTAFAVRYLNGEAQVQVERGDVDLRTRDDSARLRLSAGNSVRIGPHGFGRPEKLDVQKDLAWVQGRLVFENCPMSQVLAELRRYYPGWIVNNNEQLAQVAVTGNYRLDKPLDVVRSLAHITSARVSEYPALVILN